MNPHCKSGLKRKLYNNDNKNRPGKPHNRFYVKFLETKRDHKVKYFNQDKE